MFNNPLLCTDVYKMGHMEQYRPGTNKVYSYLMARSGKLLPYSVFFGLQYFLDRYLTERITRDHVEEFYRYRKMILGVDPGPEMREKFDRLVDRGYVSLDIKAVPEGSVVPVQNVLMTVTNTEPDAYWQVGFFESLLLKVWNTTTVASYSQKLYQLVLEYARRTCDDENHLPFQVHDFGYRGVSSEETAALSGAAHLVNFLGSDTVPAVWMLSNFYDGEHPIGLSVPASEHSVMCSYGRDAEFKAFERMLDLYPSGIVSIVSDTYNLWNVLTNFCERLRPRILARDGRVVFRPDSGNPEFILCGDPNAPDNTPEGKGAIRLLDEMFGGSVNQRGYRVLNPKVGLIYGDGFYYERFKEVLARMERMGYASSNLVVGIGGILLQKHNRDDQGFALKATYTEVDGACQEIQKDPITDAKKKSHKGLLKLLREGPIYTTHDQVSWDEEGRGELQRVFRNGKLLKRFTLQEIRNRVREFNDTRPPIAYPTARNA